MPAVFSVAGHAVEREGLAPVDQRVVVFALQEEHVADVVVALRQLLLVAQILWVLGYAALPVFFLLYAKEELGLTPAVASLWLAGFGLSTGATIALRSSDCRIFGFEKNRRYQSSVKPASVVT